jgi:hypothetical protein
LHLLAVILIDEHACPQNAPPDPSIPVFRRIPDAPNESYTSIVNDPPVCWRKNEDEQVFRNWQTKHYYGNKIKKGIRDENRING